LASQKAVEGLGIPLKVLNVSEEYLGVVKDPKHGYGRNMNPCIDCRIFMLKKAKAHMEDSGAAFIVTGEVLGQRPMSQRKDVMRLIEKEAGLEGFILRPLSAKVLPATVPEREGWVDREKLLKIQGRSRKAQMGLAENYGIHDYPCPAGGCLLTDPGFAKRMKDLMVHDPDFSLNDVHLLKMGRHFRFSPGAKLVVGRQEEENQKIQTFAQREDILLRVPSFPGPLSLLRGKLDDKDIEKAAAITAHYSKAKDLRNIEVTYKGPDEDHPQSLLASPISRGEIEKWMICE
jgi:tRNA U34 2-thiouridine synthase MnmA/TrmU